MTSKVNDIGDMMVHVMLQSWSLDSGSSLSSAECTIASDLSDVELLDVCGVGRLGLSGALRFAGVNACVFASGLAGEATGSAVGLAGEATGSAVGLAG
jgi:hypothetical protein